MAKPTQSWPLLICLALEWCIFSCFIGESPVCYNYQEEEHQLKKQLAELAINVNMEAQKKRTQDVDDVK